MRKTVLAALTLVALTTASQARTIGCAVVLRMSNGYLNLRTGHRGLLVKSLGRARPRRAPRKAPMIARRPDWRACR
jgi:hypothetical protein